jgi:hypothetical protein
MPNGNEDLWPAGVGTSTIVPPLAILRRQAVALGERTQGLLEGQVETFTKGDEFTQVFYIVAPSLSYRYKLFEVRHGVLGYPVFFTNEGRRPVFPRFGTGPAPLKLDTPDEFVEWLRQVLDSDEIKRVVGSLLSQVKA